MIVANVICDSELIYRRAIVSRMSLLVVGNEIASNALLASEIVLSLLDMVQEFLEFIGEYLSRSRPT